MHRDPGATRDDIPGDPLYYFERQVVYGVVGLVLMYGVSRLDYSRLRELKYALYGLLIGSIVLVFGLATATRGSKRWIETPVMNFQPSELGKVLLVRRARRASSSTGCAARGRARRPRA